MIDFRFRHGVIPDLIQPSLLRAVRLEILGNLSFTRKETDIYKIYQSGDLANLDGLDDSSLARLPSLLVLRNALYSQEFRNYLAAITGSGPLSGQKTDMAINIYKKGCHLLCHDDVIGSRRVSYILYLSDPDEPWKKRWGGALKLYRMKEIRGADKKKTKVPKADPVVSIQPLWNQLSFFAVQPGESYHDVEEVKGDKGVRMAISGWFHLPQKGEDGFVPGLEEELASKSSLAQLHSKADEHDLPLPNPELYPDDTKEVPKTDTERFFHFNPSKKDDEDVAKADADILTEPEISHLLKFLSPIYLTPDTMTDIQNTFLEESFLRIDNFLNDKYAATIIDFIDKQAKDVSHQSTRVFNTSVWRVATPPHKHRYLYYLPRDCDPNNQNLLAFKPRPMSPLKDILQNLLPSTAFRKWLSLATGLIITTHDVRARRFRRGYDYSLATAYEEEQPRLELTLGITPSTGWEMNDEAADTQQTQEADNNVDELGSQAEGVGEIVGKGKKAIEDDKAINESEDEQANDVAKSAASKKATRGVARKQKRAIELIVDDKNDDNVGGYEVYMAADSDPHSISTADPAVYQAAKDVEDDNGVLFSMAAGWNRLGLVLRDKGVMRFVKYVSGQAQGDRWDIVGEFDVQVDDDSGEESEGPAGDDPKGEVVDEDADASDDDGEDERETSETEDDDEESASFSFSR